MNKKDQSLLPSSLFHTVLKNNNMNVNGGSKRDANLKLHCSMTLGKSKEMKKGRLSEEQCVGEQKLISPSNLPLQHIKKPQLSSSLFLCLNLY